MHIQWFPGHMTKALRMMEEEVKLVDNLIYVIDSRAVQASFNPAFNKLLNNKTVLYVLNKSDLVERGELSAWLSQLRSEGKKVITANSTASGISKKIIESVKELNAEKINRYLARGVNKSIRSMVIGVPNSGKSTLINALCGQKRTVTGDRPGVTRGKQWVVLSKGIELLDTPGTLSPAFENQEIAKHLAFIGSIREDILDINELATELIAFYRDNYPQLLSERYKIDVAEGSDSDVLDRIARSRGAVLKGGIPDTERAARAVVDDYRKQKLGLVMFEQPDNKQTID